MSNKPPVGRSGMGIIVFQWGGVRCRRMPCMEWELSSKKLETNAQNGGSIPTREKQKVSI